jgi:O-antigen ligase
MINISRLRGIQEAEPAQTMPQRGTVRSSVFLSILVSVVVALSVLWPRNLFFSLSPLPSANPYTLCVVAFDCAIILQFFLSRNIRTRLTRVFLSAKLISACFLLWFLWRIIADLAGETPLSSAMNTFRDLAYLGSLFLIAALVTADVVGRRYIVRALLLSALITSLAGIYESLSGQYITTTLGLVNFPVTQDPQYILLNTINADSFRYGLLRAKSFFTHPIVFAQFLACMVPLAWHAARFETSYVFRFLGIAVICLIPWALLDTGTRSALITAGVGIFMLFLMANMRDLRRDPLKFVSMIIVLATVVIIIIVAWDNILLLVVGRNESEMSSSLGRITMLNRTLDALRDSPVFGFGDGNDIMKAGLVYAGSFLTMDNLFLSTVLDFGVVGLVLFLLLAGALLWRGFLLNLSARSPENSSLARAVTCGTAAILLGQSILSVNDNLSIIYLYCSIICGLCYSEARPSFRPQSGQVLRPRMLRRTRVRTTNKTIGQHRLA